MSDNSKQVVLVVQRQLSNPKPLPTFFQQVDDSNVSEEESEININSTLPILQQK